MTPKRFLAVDLNDFHDPSKKWQRGTHDFVKVRVIRASTLEKAKQRLRDLYSDHAWYVAHLGNEKCMVYAVPINEVDNEEVDNESDQ